MSEYVPVELRRLVRNRADLRCEYCLIHEEDALLPHEPDHIVATKHRGETSETNLAWTCFVCNRAKGSDLSSIDTETKQNKLFDCSIQESIGGTITWPSNRMGRSIHRPTSDE